MLFFFRIVWPAMEVYLLLDQVAQAVAHHRLVLITITTIIETRRRRTVDPEVAAAAAWLPIIRTSNHRISHPHFHPPTTTNTTSHPPPPHPPLWTTLAIHIRKPLTVFKVLKLPLPTTISWQLQPYPQAKDTMLWGELTLLTPFTWWVHFFLPTYLLRILKPAGGMLRIPIFNVWLRWLQVLIMNGRRNKKSWIKLSSVLFC